MRRAAADESFDPAIGATARQVVQFESGTGASHGPIDILIAYAGALLATAIGRLRRVIGRRVRNLTKRA